MKCDGGIYRFWPVPRRSSWRAGFTLLELMVSLLLLGLIVTLGQGGVRLGARTWETVGSRAETMGQSQMVRAFLIRELAQAAPLLAPQPDGSSRLAYEGDSRSLIFIAPLASHFGLGGLQRMRLAIVEDFSAPDRGKRLVLTRRPYYADDDFTAESDLDEEHVLLTAITDAGFAYREDPAGGIAGWSGEWQGRDTLPLMIRLTIDFGDGRGLDWPELTVPIRITATPGCLIPAGRPGCIGG